MTLHLRIGNPTLLAKKLWGKSCLRFDLEAFAVDESGEEFPLFHVPGFRVAGGEIIEPSRPGPRDNWPKTCKCTDDGVTWLTNLLIDAGVPDKWPEIELPK